MQVLARRRGYTLVEFLTVLGIVTIMAAIVGPVFQGTRCGYSPSASCASNLKQIGLASMQYTQDFDEKLSPIAIDSAEFYGWADALQPYLKATQIYRCPTKMARDKKPSNVLTLEYWVKDEPKNPTPRERGYTDYWMNAHLSRVELKNMDSPGQSILSGDGNDGTDSTNARYNLPSLPSAWLKDKQGPAYRHGETMNILFADGHVKAMEARRITTGAPNVNTTATFATNWRE